MKSKSAVANSSTPSHVLLSPTDNSKVLDFINFNTVGSNTVNNSTAFKKIQSASKSSSQSLFAAETDYSLKYNKLNNLYLTDYNSQDSLYYGIKRQHEYATTLACLNNAPSLLDNDSVQKMLDYNFDLTMSTKTYNNTSLSEFRLPAQNMDSNAALDSVLLTTTALENVNEGEFGTGTVTKNSSLTPHLNQDITPTALINQLPTSNLNTGLIYKEFFAKSPNQQVLSSDRNVRNLDTVRPGKANYNFSDVSKLVNKLSTRFDASHAPTTELNSNTTSVAYDRFTSNNMNASIMSAKEELAPNFLFTPF